MNVHKEMLKTLEVYKIQGIRPRVLLHSCCAPCSTYVIEFLKDYCDLTVFFYNPNIAPREEYELRQEAQIQLIQSMGLSFHVVTNLYDGSSFYEAIKGLEHLGERSDRCIACYRLRLMATATYGAEHLYDFFATTLTISPLKLTQKINAIGTALEGAYPIRYLASDFKKNDGFKRSVALSKAYKLYRQDYCGCIYSKEESMNR